MMFPLPRSIRVLVLAPSVLLILALVLSLFLAPAAQAAVTDDLLAVGQLRLQSQRLAKLYLQSGLEIQSEKARGQLQKALRQMDGVFTQLAPYARQARTGASLARTRVLWNEMQQALAAPYSLAAWQRVVGAGDELMLASGRLSLLIEEQGDGAMGRLLDLSLRQNMLAQRLARLYLMGLAGDQSQGRQVDAEQARREFNTALAELAGARENTVAAREALELARMQWLFFDQALVGGGRGAGSDPHSLARNVATTSERIAEVLEAVSHQYARASVPGASG